MTGEEITVHAFPKDISSKVNMTAWLGFELAYYDIIVQPVSHYTTTPRWLSYKNK